VVPKLTSVCVYVVRMLRSRDNDADITWKCAGRGHGIQLFDALDGSEGATFPSQKKVGDLLTRSQLHRARSACASCGVHGLYEIENVCVVCWTHPRRHLLTLWRFGSLALRHFGTLRGWEVFL
jgi:hypothetical protein